MAEREAGFPYQLISQNLLDPREVKRLCHSGAVLEVEMKDMFCLGLCSVGQRVLLGKFWERQAESQESLG